MSVSFSSTVKAGRLLRLMGWINLVFIISIAAAIAIPAYAQSQPIAVPIWIVFFCAVGLSVFYLFVGAGVKSHKPWAKVAAVVLSVLALFNFPVGTLIGIAILYYLVKGWNESIVNAAPDSSAT